MPWTPHDTMIQIFNEIQGVSAYSNYGVPYTWMRSPADVTERLKDCQAGFSMGQTGGGISSANIGNWILFALIFIIVIGIILSIGTRYLRSYLTDILSVSKESSKDKNK